MHMPSSRAWPVWTTAPSFASADCRQAKWRPFRFLPHHRRGSACACGCAATCVSSIRIDSLASIQNDGLVGNKVIQIEPGTDGSPVVEDGGTIRSREPFDLADLMQRMSETIVTVNKTIVHVQAQLTEALAAISSTAKDGGNVDRRRGQGCPVDSSPRPIA